MWLVTAGASSDINMEAIIIMTDPSRLIIIDPE